MTNELPRFQEHFHCRSCGYDVFNVPVGRCPECGRWPRQERDRTGRLVFLILFLGLVGFASFNAFERHYTHYMAELTLKLQGGIPSRELRAVGIEESLVPALAVGVIGALIALGYAYFFIVEPGATRRLVKWMKRKAGMSAVR